MVTIKGRVVEQTTEGADEHIDKLEVISWCRNISCRPPNVKRIILQKRW